jgi:hypothetical protein
MLLLPISAGDVATPLEIETAAAWARRQVAAVRDDPAARLELADAIYEGAAGLAPDHPRFRRAAMSFLRWEVGRGVLNPLDAERPGSQWWRAISDRLLQDECEAAARCAGLSGEISSPSIPLWMTFVAEPTAQNWYRAHNSTVVAAYLQHRDLAGLENRAERFFLNVVLLRVLYAHALVAAPALALGRFAALGPALGDPRLGMAGIFLSLGRVLPDGYPLTAGLDSYLRTERGFGRMLDFAVIAPRLQHLYEWSADELEQPGLCELIDDGSPAYAWRSADRHVWDPAPMSIVAATLKLVTSQRDPGQPSHLSRHGDRGLLERRADPCRPCRSAAEPC